MECWAWKEAERTGEVWARLEVRSGYKARYELDALGMP